MARLIPVSAFVAVSLTLTTAAWAVGYKVVVLNPPGSLYAELYATSGNQQVGHGSISASGEDHALLWSGTPDSVVDLTPTGFNWAEAWGVEGGQQVGRGHGSATGGAEHALLWSGTPGSLIDLHPAGLLAGSDAYGVSGGQQVGHGWEGVAP